jgi:FG-GAP-like repeat
VASQDFDADGNVDMVASNFNGNSISVFLGTGGGTFAAAVLYTTQNNPYGVAVGDYDRDGNVDIVSANVNSASMSLFKGNGDGTFQNQVVVGTGAIPTIPAIKDLNNLGLFVVPVILSSLILCFRSGRYYLW